MKRYRSRLRIVADILSIIASEGRAGPTRIMYGANLSHERLVKYLKRLEELGLIKSLKMGDRTAYELTEKGLDFLAEFRRIEAFSKAFGVEV
ncbi:MAG: hypothetical protein DRJ97_06255 [Thermoprotei archaeon]|nr:MAG: hypothetical protein DRJ97_06255 [Thermoprotei archaeon]